MIARCFNVTEVGPGKKNSEWGIYGPVKLFVYYLYITDHHHPLVLTKLMENLTEANLVEDAFICISGKKLSNLL